MQNLRRNSQVCYIASKIEGSSDYGTPNYGEPFLFRENIKPISGEDAIVEFGDRVSKMYVATPQKRRWKDKIKEGDVAYLEGITPVGENIHGAASNFNVSSVRYTLTTMSIYFEKKI